MNQGKYVFSQLTDFLTRCTFDGIVETYNGNYGIRTFTCWNQLLCMIFGQPISQTKSILNPTASTFSTKATLILVGITKSNKEIPTLSHAPKRI